MQVKRTVALGAAAGLALAAAGGGVAATVHGKSHQAAPSAQVGGRPGGPGDDLDAAAAYLGITSAQLLSDLQAGQTPAQVANATSGKSASGLIAALVTHETAELDAAVAAGKLTSAQEQTLLANLQQRFTDFVNATKPDGGPGPGGPGHPGGRGPGGDDLDAAAAYLGITSAQLLSDLQAGQTPAQVANATSGKSASGLVAALVTHETAALDAAVAAGKLTSAQEQTLLANLQQRFTDFVNATKPDGGPGGPGHPGGKGPGGDDLDAAAAYLGITSAQLLSDLQGGQTPAQVANATSGKSAAGLIAALVTHETAELDTAVAAGKLTLAQEQTLVANLQQRFTDFVNGLHPPRARART